MGLNVLVAQIIVTASPATPSTAALPASTTNTISTVHSACFAVKFYLAAPSVSRTSASIASQIDITSPIIKPVHCAVMETQTATHALVNPCALLASIVHIS